MTNRTAARLTGRAALVLVVLLVCACSSSAPSTAKAAAGNAAAGNAAATENTCQQVSAVLGDGPDPVAASLRMADPGQEEVARSLGSGRIKSFARITLGQAKGAIGGGCLLVALVLLAEYGAFEILGYQTFTTEISASSTATASPPPARYP